MDSSIATMLGRLDMINPCNWVFIFGNGFSKSLIGKDHLKRIEWGEILKQWIDELGDRLSRKQRCFASGAIKSGDADLMIGAADLILFRFGPEERKDVLQRTFAPLGALVDDTSEWCGQLLKMRSLIQDGKMGAPLFITTNFDDLFSAKTEFLLQSWSLRREEFVDPVNKPLLDALKDATWLRSVPSHLKRLSRLDQLEELRERRLLGLSDTPVYHIHGWWKMPSSLVFDCAGYDRSIVDKDFINRRLQHLLEQPNRIVVFWGVGEGMFDRRFRHLWKVEGKNNFWVVSRPANYLSQAEAIGAIPPTLEMVECKRELQPGLLGRALERFSQN